MPDYEKVDALLEMAERSPNDRQVHELVRFGLHYLYEQAHAHLFQPVRLSCYNHIPDWEVS